VMALPSIKTLHTGTLNRLPTRKQIHFLTLNVMSNQENV